MPAQLVDDQNTQNPLPQYLQENFCTKELINSLPKERGFLTPNMYNYKGFWFSDFHLQGTIRFQKNFNAQDCDVMLITLPKSGTIWLKALVFALTTRNQFLVSQETHPLLTNNPHDLIPFMEVSYAREETPSFALYNGVRLLSTHVPYSLLPESVQLKAESKIIYLCRSPKDTFVSYWHFANKLRGENQGKKGSNMPILEALESYCRGVSLAGPFWDHVLGYWKESLENSKKVLFLKYEEIKEEPEEHLRRIATFLECPFSREEEELGVVGEILKLCSFDRLSNLEVNKSGKGLFGNENSVMFRKGEVGDWKNHLSNDMAHRLDEIVEEKFKGTNLKL